jgi:hypothetical protein
VIQLDEAETRTLHLIQYVRLAVFHEPTVSPFWSQRGRSSTPEKRVNLLVAGDLRPAHS